MKTKKLSSNQKLIRAYWRKKLFDFLFDFSIDKIKEQLNNPKYMRTLTEDTCHYFDALFEKGVRHPQWVVDNFSSNLYKGNYPYPAPQWIIKNKFLSPKEWEKLKEFHNFFSFFTDKLNKDDMEYPEVLNNPDFIKLCTLAQKALTGLRALQEKSV